MLSFRSFIILDNSECLKFYFVYKNVCVIIIWIFTINTIFRCLDYRQNLHTKYRTSKERDYKNIYIISKEFYCNLLSIFFNLFKYKIKVLQNCQHCSWQSFLSFGSLHTLLEISSGFPWDLHTRNSFYKSYRLQYLSIYNCDL